MSEHNSFVYATDQSDDQQHPASSAAAAAAAALTGFASDSGHQAPLMPLSSTASQTASLSASPQLQVPSVASINASPAPSSLSNMTITPSSEIFYSPTVTHHTDCLVYSIDQNRTEVMEHKVRQFYSAEGASFIEHVPGHCLVFIPNSTSVDYLLGELRRVRQPRRRNKQPKDKSNKPTNAFIKYRNHKIVELKRMHPEISQTEISRMAGECWRTEPEELKDGFRKLYQEEKRVYDMNKSKNTNTESEVGSDVEVLSDTMSMSSLQTAGRSSVAPLTSDPHDPMVGSNNSSLGFGLGLGLGLGIGADGNPIGFNAGRRRSHTLPPGGFTRSGTKRRISQEFRKHLASKKAPAYMNANANNVGTSAGMFVDVMQTYPTPSQQMQSQYDFTFTPPQIETSASSSTMSSGSPYMSCETTSPMTLPLNPNFPIADFTTTDSTAVAASQSMHQHTRSLTSISAPLPIDTSVFATDTTFGSFVPNPVSISKSLADSSMNVSLPMIDTTNLGVFANDGMSLSAFSTGYLSTDQTPWPLSSTYNMLPDSSGTSQQQTQQFSQQQSHIL